MSYQERRSIVAVTSTVLINAIYAAVMLQRYPQTGDYSPEIFRFWGAYFLILVVVTIVAKIVIQIMFSILHTIATQEGEPSFMDERDRLIEWRSARNAVYVFGGGFVLAMAALVIGLPPAAMFAVLLCSGVLSDILSDVSQFFLYRRGF